MKDKKWMRGLPSDMIKTILKFEPDEISYTIFEPEFLVFTIEKKIGHVTRQARGVAICSPIDAYKRLHETYIDYDDFVENSGFNVNKGKKIAAARAIAAFKKRQNSHPIRDKFSSKWLPCQVKHLQGIKKDWFEYKSNYAVE